MANWQKIVACGALLSSFSSLHAEESKEYDTKEETKLERKDQRHKEEKKYIEGKITNLANSYIPALRNAMQIWVHADLLYFVPTISSMDYTTQKSDVLTTSNFTSKPLVNSNFEWQVGYQAGFGYLFPKTHWDITFKGTHYHSWAQGNKSTNGDLLQGMFPVWSLADDILAGDYVTDSQIKGRLTFNRLLLQGGYFFQPSEWFVVRTWVGLESASLKQHYDVEYSGGVFASGTDYIHLKNNFWGMGPQVGMYPWLLLGKGWSLFGKASLSWLCGRFKVNQNETYLDQQRYKHNADVVKGRWSTDTEAGVQWKRLFYHERFSFALRYSWEYLVYYQQNQLTKDQYNKLSGGGIQIQGSVLSVLFDF